MDKRDEPPFFKDCDECEERQKEKEFPSAKDELSLIDYFMDESEA
ncbi:MAG: hypothetical protein ACW97O_03740 [Candidatus Thorarchaeota archaeon]|jgi:hypothetical protein